ncbi:nardilysin-like [Nilaparvata lugens]|uniref:nardilysin-like n=1 Tax=Nilaparvata lugens TaxID=108931 RepID=UPI00193CD1AC|nr:nardilysin-like [Nilaparvata lugens]
MDVLDAEDEMIPIDVLKFSNFSYETPPTKSSTDKKEYAVIKLNNGLTALLISDQSDLGGASQDYDGDEEVDDDDNSEDEETEFNYDAEDEESESFNESYNDTESISHSESSIGVSVLEDDSSYENEKLGMSACAVCVDVGSFNDPEDMPGLAHLLEHVIGAGSRIHPAEEKFGSLVHELGGSFFSATRCECATYYFDCLKDNIQFFLDRFSKHLISPVLDHDTIEEEIENIKYEFQSSVWSNNHVNRKLIMCSTANKTNPAHKIVNGNKIINQNISRESLLRQLCEFWKKNYSAHRITLAIQSKHALKTLEMWVEKYFFDIPCNNLPAEVFPPCETPFKTEEFCKLYTVEPFEDEHLLQISWVLPSVVKLYKSKPLHYIRWLVVQECSGSLLAFLRMKNWASKVTCNDPRSTVDFNSIYSIFSIKITLTHTGLDHLEDACCVIFTYIKFLRESIPVSWIFNEIKTVADILFTHSTETWPLLNVKNLAENMRLYPSTDYLQGEHIFSEYGSDLISQLLELMKPNKANIMITSLNKSENVPLDHVESLLGKKYHKSDYNSEFEIEDHTAKEYFCLPNANPFIANDFSIWMPLKMRVFQKVVRQEIYAALTCGYDYSLSFDENGFEIFLYGFNDKLILLLESVLECVKKSGSISDLISDEEFEEFFESAISKTDLENKPFKLCYQMIQKVIFTPSWSYFDKLSVDKTDEPLTRSHLDSFAKTFLQTSTLKCFINGNISKEQAMLMMTKT